MPRAKGMHVSGGLVRSGNWQHLMTHSRGIFKTEMFRELGRLNREVAKLLKEKMASNLRKGEGFGPWPPYADLTMALVFAGIDREGTRARLIRNLKVEEKKGKKIGWNYEVGIPERTELVATAAHTGKTLYAADLGRLFEYGATYAVTEEQQHWFEWALKSKAVPQAGKVIYRKKRQWIEPAAKEVQEWGPNYIQEGTEKFIKKHPGLRR